MDLKNIILFFIFVINLIIGFAIFFKSKKKDEIVWVYLSFACWTSFWTLGIGLFQLSAEPFWLWFWNVEFIIAASLIISSLLHFSLIFKAENKVSFWQKSLIYLPNIVVTYAALTSGVLIKDIIVQPWGNESILGWGYIYYGIYFFAYICLVFYNLWKKFSLNTGIERAQIVYLSLGLSISLLIGGIFNLFLILLGNYQFVWLGPYASCIMIAFAGYAIIKYRFLNVKLTITNTAKKIISFSVAYTFGSAFFLSDLYGNEFVGLFLSFLIFYPIYTGIGKLLNSHYFAENFNLSSAEQLQDIVNKLKNNLTIPKTLPELEKNLKKEFWAKLPINELKILILDSQTKKQYPNLVKYLQEKPQIIATQELEFLQKQEKKEIPFLAELKTLGAVCLPLLQYPNHELIGLFSLGEKQCKDPYSTEELQALQSLNRYLSMALMSVIYNQKLHEEIVRLKSGCKQLNRNSEPR